MTRSVWKGPFVDGYLLKKADAARGSGRADPLMWFVFVLINHVLFHFQAVWIVTKWRAS